MIRNKISSIGLFLFSAALLSCAMSYPQKLGFFVFFFLIPILLYLEKHKDVHKSGMLFKSMFVFNFTYLAVSTSWFLSVFPLDWLKITDPILSIFIIVPFWFAFLAAMSILMAFWPLLLLRVQTSVMAMNAGIAASLWVLIEYIRSWVLAFGVYGNETLFGPHNTYYSIAYPVSAISFLQELFPVGGIYLVSFIIILCNYFLYYSYVWYIKRSTDFRALVLLGSIIMIGIFVSVSVVHRVRESDKAGVSFTATVVNMQEPSLNTIFIAEEKIRKAVTFIETMKNTDGIIIFPENINILPSYLDEKQDKKVLRIPKLIIGSFTGHQFYNMYFFTPQDKKIEYYRKQLLMPIGEYNISWMDFLIQKSSISSWVNAYTASKHTSKKGNTETVFSYLEIPGLIFGGSLCSENISPYIYRNATKLGATVLLNIASHAPFHGSDLLARQTLAINTARALESGRYLITSSNYGVSFVITDEGAVRYVSNTQKEGSLANVSIEVKKYITPFVAYGDYIIYISVLILCIRVIWLRKIFDYTN